MSNSLAPVLYLPHGGGPLPLMGDTNHKPMIEFLKTIPSQLGTPEAILVISAHWEAEQATLTAAAKPELIFDYYNFPPEAYEYQYPAPGEPQLAQEAFELIKNANIDVMLDDQRGFDHGLFVPLMLMYPQANIPCIQLSLTKDLDPEKHIKLGKSLAELRKRNVLIVGSGMSFHNLKTFFEPSSEGNQQSDDFDDWLQETCCNDLTNSMQRLIEWEKAPHARYCHPRQEHLLPLHVCYGIACTKSPKAEVVYNDELMGKRVSALLWN